MRHLRSFLAALVLSSVAAAAEPPTLPLGSPAVDFDLPGVDGKRYSLKDFADAKVLVLVFTTNHCPTALNYEERLKQIVMDYRDKGVALVAINPNSPLGLRLDERGYTDLGDSFEEMKIRARDHAFNFPYLHDGDTEEASRKYGPVSTPHCFVFDAERRLQYTGRVDNDERPGKAKVHDLRNAIDAVLDGREAPVTRTKSFGCSVKWADKKGSVEEYMAKLAAEPVSMELADEAAINALRKSDSRKLRLINVWSIRCGPCVTEFPDFVSIHRMYLHRAFEFVAVCADDPEDRGDALAFLKKQQASHRNVVYSGEDKYALVEAVDPEWSGALPHTILVNPVGEVVFRHTGAVDALELRRAIVKSLKEDRFKE